jgi:hypothetical protein
MTQNTVDKTSERVNRKTPNGGEYSIAYFVDKNGNPIDKDKAERVEIIEFDANDKQIRRTYGFANSKIS